MAGSSPAMTRGKAVPTKLLHHPGPLPAVSTQHDMET